MRPGARRHQVPPPLPGLPGAGPPQPSAGRGETRQRVPWRSRRIRPIRRLLRARLRLLPPPPHIPEPPDSLAASAARGVGRAGPAPAPPLARTAARQLRPHLIEGPRPLGHAPPLPAPGVEHSPVCPRLAPARSALASHWTALSELRLPRRVSLAGERGMTPAKGGVGLPEAERAGAILWRAEVARTWAGARRPRARCPPPRGARSETRQNLWISITRPNLSTGVRWFLQEIIVDLSLLNAFVKNYRNLLLILAISM